jgi:hypothetical protein
MELDEIANSVLPYNNAAKATAIKCRLFSPPRHQCVATGQKHQCTTPNCSPYVPATTTSERKAHKEGEIWLTVSKI